MTAKRLHTIMIASVAVLLLALPVGTYALNSLLTIRGNSLLNQKARSQALDQQQLSLQQAKQQIKQYDSLEKITKVVVPEDKDQAEAVRQIVAIAASSGISLSSITFPASTLGTSTLPSPTSSTGTSSGTTNPALLSGNSVTNKLSQLTAIKNIPGVYNLPIVVQSNSDAPVAYNKFVHFLSGLENNRRTAQVVTISLQPDAKNRNLLSFNLILNEYIKP